MEEGANRLSKRDTEVSSGTVSQEHSDQNASEMVTGISLYLVKNLFKSVYFPFNVKIVTL